MRTKENYISELEEELKRCGIEDVDRYIEYYEEIIMDAMEDGKSEEEAISSLDSTEDVVKNILYEKRTVERVLTKKLSPLTMILLVLGAPLWAPLLAVVACLALVAILLLGIAYFVLWLIPFILGLFAITGILGGVYGIFGSLPFMFNQFAPGIMQLGLSIFMLGAGLLCLFVLRKTVHSFALKSVQLARKVKTILKGSVRKYGFRQR